MPFLLICVLTTYHILPLSFFFSVNALFAGANTIYEPEVDTHLNVLHIAYTTIYDGAGSSSNALSIMRTNYARGYSQPWWYTSPSGDEPDLHHLLSGQSLGGGVAYLSGKHWHFVIPLSLSLSERLGLL